jgi:hypothetical protein
MKTGSRIIGDLAEANAAGAVILDLDGADDQDFALMAAPPATGDRIVFAAAGDFGFIHLEPRSVCWNWPSSSAMSAKLAK